MLRFTAVLTLLCSSPALPSALHAQTAPYTEGSVWAMSMVHVTSGRFDDYYNDLRASLKRQMDEAKREGLILSYRLISTDAMGPDDWNALLMVEYKNMAALDGLRAKMEPIASRMIGPRPQRRERALKRNEIRTLVGTKLGREIVLRDSVVDRASR